MFYIKHKLLTLLIFVSVSGFFVVSSQTNCIGTWHTVQQGENLFRLSLNYGVSMNTVAQINGITNPALIYAGQRICMPTKTSPSSQNSSSPNTTTINTVVKTITPTTTSSPTQFDISASLNLCLAGNAWAGRCTSDWMWQAGYYVGLYRAGHIPFELIPSQFRSATQSITSSDTSSSDILGGSARPLGD